MQRSTLSAKTLSNVPLSESLSTKNAKLPPKPHQDMRSVAASKMSAKKANQNSNNLEDSVVNMHIVKTQLSWQTEEQIEQLIDNTKSNKTKMLKVLKELDRENTKTIAYTMFQQTANDHNIQFDQRSHKYIIKNLCDVIGRVNYINLVDNMVIRLNSDFTGTFQCSWHLRQAIETSKHGDTATQFSDNGSCKSSKKGSVGGKSRAGSASAVSRKSQGGELTSKHQKTSSQILDRPDFDDDKQHTTNVEMQAALNKIIIPKPFNREEISKIRNLSLTSASCDVLGLKRHNYHEIFLKANSISPQILQDREYIKMYLRQNQVQLRQLMMIQTCFLKCDKLRTGCITKKRLVLKLAKNNVRLPEHLLQNLLLDMQLDSSEQSEDAILVYKNLLDIIEVFQQTPAIMPADRNNSTQFVNSLERQPMLKPASQYDRLDKLFQHVHDRIIEKYVGFREAFRRFDKNFDGSLNFREFVSGMNEMGIMLTMPDFRLLFEKIDFDNEGEIDYFKFCLLDFEKNEIREKLKEGNVGFGATAAGHKVEKILGFDDDGKNGHPIFRDGLIPKNKNPVMFTEAINQKTKTKQFLETKKMIEAYQSGLKNARDLPNGHIFGVGSELDPTHDMAKIVKNEFNKDFQVEFDHIKETYRPQFNHKTLKPPKPTKSSTLKLKKANDLKEQEQKTEKPTLRRSNSALNTLKNDQQVQATNLLSYKQLKDKVDEMWPQLETMDERVSKTLARSICQQVITFTKQWPQNLFEQCYKVIQSQQDEASQECGLTKEELKVLLKNLQAVIHVNQKQKVEKRSESCDRSHLSEVGTNISIRESQRDRALTSAELHRMATADQIKQGSRSFSVSALSNAGSAVSSSKYPKLPADQDIKIRQISTKLLKQFDSKKKFDREEAFKFVQTVLRQARVSQASQGLVGFDAIFKVLCGEISKKSTLDFSMMSNLCVKVAAYSLSKQQNQQRPPSQHGDFQMFKADKLSSKSLQNLNVSKPTTHQIQQALRTATTPEKVESCIDLILQTYDPKGAGVLYKEEARRFVDKVLIPMHGNGYYNQTEFSDWFWQYDTDYSGAIERPELAEFITKVALTESKGHKAEAQPFAIAEGKRNIKKLTDLWKIGSLDYLKICALTKKIFRYFDLDGNAVLDKQEGKIFLDALIHQMNFASALMSKEEFRNWFAAIDQDGSSALSLNELIPALAEFFKVPVPKGKEDDSEHKIGEMLVGSSVKNNLNDSQMVRQALNSDKKTMNLVKQIWNQYDVDGNGYLNRQETKHFCMKYLRDFKNIDCVPDQGFDAWFKKIDRDGNGQVDMVEMAHYIKDLAKALQRPKMDNAGGENQMNVAQAKQNIHQLLESPHPLLNVDKEKTKNGLQKLKVIKKKDTTKSGLEQDKKAIDAKRKPIVVTVASLIQQPETSDFQSVVE